MNEVEIPDDISDNFLKEYLQEGFRSRKMRDEIYLEKGVRKDQMREEVERVIGFIKEKVFVKVGL
jgi:hypothetical protein